MPKCSDFSPKQLGSFPRLCPIQNTACAAPSKPLPPISISNLSSPQPPPQENLNPLRLLIGQANRPCHPRYIDYIHFRQARNQKRALKKACENGSSTRREHTPNSKSLS
jgi:hypothetical protein